MTTNSTSRQDQIMDLIHKFAAVENKDQFSELVEGPLKAVLGFEIMVAGIGGISSRGNCIHKLINFDYPYEYFRDIQDPDSGIVDSPLMKEWRNTQEPVVFQSGRDDDKYPANWVETFKKYDLRNKIGHGIMDVSGISSSFFIFSRFADEVGQKHADLVKIIIPMMHIALLRILTGIEPWPEMENNKKIISDRQTEILQWMKEGKSNWEIANILGLTESNVKYHIDQILDKLKASNRINAVIKAQYLGLICNS